MKKKLGKMSYDEMVKLCYKQSKDIDDIRGYDCGLTEDMLRIFDKDELIEMFIQTEKDFGLNTEM